MLLAFDLDKTLLTDDYRLPDENAEAVHAARDAGHLVTVLTGRPHAAAVPFAEAIGVREFYSVNHGALVLGRAGAVLHRRRLLPPDVTALVARVATLHHIEFSCVVDDCLYVRDPSSERWAWAHTENRRLEAWTEELELHADKVVFAANGEGEALEKAIRASHPELVTYLWGDGFLEITEADADKGFALALLAKELGVPRDEVIAFGDGLNDVTMLEWAGRGIAVGPQAHARVLEAADEHIAPPEEGGVAAWLRANLL